MSSWVSVLTRFGLKVLLIWKTFLHEHEQQALKASHRGRKQQ